MRDRHSCNCEDEESTENDIGRKRRGNDSRMGMPEQEIAAGRTHKKETKMTEVGIKTLAHGNK